MITVDIDADRKRAVRVDSQLQRRLPAFAATAPGFDDQPVGEQLAGDVGDRGRRQPGDPPAVPGGQQGGGGSQAVRQVQSRCGGRPPRGVGGGAGRLTLFVGQAKGQFVAGNSADAMASAFDSAGQRCSAARVLFVQADIADKVVNMLSGAMDELVVGDPGLLSTDVGPVIDEDARRILAEHAARMDKEATLIKEVKLPEAAAHGCFFAPRAYELTSLSQLTREVFGPVLHVIRFEADKLDEVLDYDFIRRTIAFSFSFTIPASTSADRGKYGIVTIRPSRAGGNTLRSEGFSAASTTSAGGMPACAAAPSIAAA